MGSTIRTLKMIMYYFEYDLQRIYTVELIH